MSELTPTRGLLIALTDERRTMREGYAFLDEKCVLLAGEMLRQLRVHQALADEVRRLQANARTALSAALVRHGLDGLLVYPASPPRPGVLLQRRPLLGVMLLSAQVAAEAGRAEPAVHAVNPSPEAEACRAAHAALADRLVELAGLSATLARLLAEYRRTVRRVRALQDVLLPELDADITDVDTRLEDMEREEAVTTRRRR